MLMGTVQPMSSGTLNSPWENLTPVTGMGRPLKKMSFQTSIQRCFQKYATFEGRASRSEYWWFVLFYQVAITILDKVEIAAMGTDPSEVMLSGFFFLAVFIPSLAVAVRRLHDSGKSGWFILIPFYNIYLLIVDGESMPNSYGAVPTND